MESKRQCKCTVRIKPSLVFIILPIEFGHQGRFIFRRRELAFDELEILIDQIENPFDDY